MKKLDKWFVICMVDIDIEHEAVERARATILFIS